MNKTTSHKPKENGHALACPHCRAGMYWEFQDQCWLCILCGHRENEHLLRLKSMAEMVAVRVWEEIFDDLDEETKAEANRARSFGIRNPRSVMHA